jgi:tRNA(fMet)-specific endonuclease VapC
LTAQLEAVLGAIAILSFDEPADVTYGRLRAALERVGRPIGGNDLLIAAQAVTLGCSIVTDNEREFRQVPDLLCENWLS